MQTKHLPIKCEYAVNVRKATRMSSHIENVKPDVIVA